MPSVPTSVNPQNGCVWCVQGSVNVPQRVSIFDSPVCIAANDDAMLIDLQPGRLIDERDDLERLAAVHEPRAER